MNGCLEWIQKRQTLQSCGGNGHMEERMITVFKRLDMSDDAWTKYDDRMKEIKRKAFIRGQKIAFAERIFWMILSGDVGLCFVYLR